MPFEGAFPISYVVAFPFIPPPPLGDCQAFGRYFTYPPYPVILMFRYLPLILALFLSFCTPLYRYMTIHVYHLYLYTTCNTTQHWPAYYMYIALSP